MKSSMGFGWGGKKVGWAWWGDKEWVGLRGDYAQDYEKEKERG
jgi:hypothetical protein